MEQIKEFIDKVMGLQIVDIIIAVCIIVLFIALSSSMSYGIVKLFKIREKKGRKIRESAFYKPLKLFISLLGIYVAILFLNRPLQINEQVMNFVNKCFIIVSILIFARGLAQSFVPNSTLVIRWLKKANKEEIDSSMNFILKAIRIIIYVIAGFLVITTLGINLNGLIAGFGITGVIVTLAAQDTAKNLFGGLVIFLDKPFAVGDWIQFDNFEGTVEDITFRSTRIRTFENSVVNVPNSVLSNTSINNWSKMEKRRVKIILCLVQDTPLDKVQRVCKRIEDMLYERDGIIDDSVIVKFDEISDNGINILIYSFTNSIDYNSYLVEKEKVNYRIMKILDEEKINLSYDTKTVYLKN